eukprot:gene36039-44448_t
MAANPNSAISEEETKKQEKLKRDERLLKSCGEFREGDYNSVIGQVTGNNKNNNK